MKRRCKSVLGNYLAPLIHKFLLDNAKTIENDDSVTVEVAMEDLSNAIEFGMASALSSPVMQSAFSVGIAPPPVAPYTPPPTESDESMQRKKQEEIARLRRMRGRGSTIMTGGMGVLGGAPTQRKTLLGG